MIQENNIDIILGSETHLSPHISDKEFIPASHACIRRDREDGYGGAIIITKKDLVVEEIVKSETCEFLAIKIQTHRQPLIIATAYRPPSSTFEYAGNISKEITKLNTKYKNNPIWFGGDMNLPDINWETNSVIKHQYLKDINDCFLDTFLSCNLEQIVNFPTRGNNTLEIVVTNRPNLVRISDHETTILLDINCHAKKVKQPKRQIFMWNRLNTILLKNHVSAEVEVFMNNNTTGTHINDIWSNFKRIVATSMDLVPTKLTSTRFTRPWVTRTCKQYIRRKQRAYNRAKSTGLQSDWKSFKTLTKESRKECKRAYNKYVSDCICPDLKNNPKIFFSFIKSKKCENIGVSPLRDSKGKLHTDDKVKANLLNRQFISVFSNDDAITPTMLSTRSPNMPEITVTINGVTKLLEKLNPYKASGPDMVSARFLEEVATEISPALT